MGPTRRFIGLLLKNPSMIGPALKLEYARNIALPWRQRFHPEYAGLPANVGLNLTRRCNLKCKMCMQNRHGEVSESTASWFDARRELPVEQWLKLVDELASFRPWVSVTGGEPLLYYGFSEIIRTLKEKKLPTDLTTNGVLLENVAELLVELGVEIVYVSVDGPEEIHEEIRGLKGCFTRTTSGIQALLNARKRRKSISPIVIMNCTMTKSNVSVLDRMVPLALEQGVDMIQFIHPFFNTTPERGEAQRRILPGIRGKERPGCGSSVITRRRALRVRHDRIRCGAHEIAIEKGSGSGKRPYRNENDSGPWR